MAVSTCVCASVLTSNWFSLCVHSYSFISISLSWSKRIQSAVCCILKSFTFIFSFLQLYREHMLHFSKYLLLLLLYFGLQSFLLPFSHPGCPFSMMNQRKREFRIVKDEWEQWQDEINAHIAQTVLLSSFDRKKKKTPKLNTQRAWEMVKYDWYECRDCNTNLYWIYCTNTRIEYISQSQSASPSGNGCLLQNDSQRSHIINFFLLICAITNRHNGNMKLKVSKRAPFELEHKKSK